MINAMSAVSRTKLKGGSLSGTYLCAEENRKFIRKEVSLTENREFGFYRWFSQLKKLQRLGRMFPDLFPKVLDVGAAGGMAYFDLEYIEGGVSGFEFLKNDPTTEEVEEFFGALVEAMDRLHSIKMPSFEKGIDLYIDQEVKRALDISMEDPFFREFAEHPTIVFNGREVRPLFPRLGEFYSLARKHYRNPEECLTHGNITLENILYLPNERRAVLIDLYEENYIDNIYNEYSQILQSSNSYYEVYNGLAAEVRGNSVSISAPRYAGLDEFNRLMGKLLDERLDQSGRIMVKLYEASQFTRMLPFKKAVAPDKMAFFYALASDLFDSITRSHGI